MEGPKVRRAEKEIWHLELEVDITELCVRTGKASGRSLHIRYSLTGNILNINMRFIVNIFRYIVSNR